MRGVGGLRIAAWLVGPLGLLVAVGCFWAARAGYQATTVGGDSMAPTYAAGDMVVFAQGGGEEAGRGDVVLFTAPDRYGPGVLVMHRVIGVGGDHVVCCTGEGADARITVNGRPLDEPYVADGVADGVRPYDVTVEQGRLFLLGDHRTNSRDSRFFTEDHGGTVPLSAVRGRVTDDWSVPVALVVAALCGVVAALTGLGLGIAAAVLRRRRSAPVPPWPARV